MEPATFWIAISVVGAIQGLAGLGAWKWLSNMQRAIETLQANDNRLFEKLPKGACSD